MYTSPRIRGRSMAVKHLLRIIVTFSFSCAAGRAQEAASRFGSAVSAEDGRALFQIHCAYCHGSRGEGGRGADLTTGQYRRGGTDENLYNTVRNGIPGTEMPAVKATDEEVWKMVAFVRRI